MTQTTAAADRDEPLKGPRRSGLAHIVALVRSAVYSVVATSYFIVMTALSAWVVFVPPGKVRALLRWWAAGDVLLMRLILGQKVEVRGTHNRPEGPALVASKHQAAWETVALIPLLPNAVIILKKELLKIPVYGWYARYFGMIPVDRSAGSAALKQLARDGQAAVDKGYQIIIFPEGTRQMLGAAPDYKIGAIYLYSKLDVPMVPVALNSGVLWPRRRFVRYPGTIVVSFLPPIPPGLPRVEALERLQMAIERETDRLVAEATQAAR